MKDVNYTLRAKTDYFTLLVAKALILRNKYILCDKLLQWWSKPSALTCIAQKDKVHSSTSDADATVIFAQFSFLRAVIFQVATFMVIHRNNQQQLLLILPDYDFCDNSMSTAVME